jgi:flagellar basal-body rod modification protein FlgD
MGTDVSSISGITQTALTSASTSTSSENVLGKDDFLKLLVTQMQNQDPMSPMENTEFVAQLAQFSALEQMQNLNENFTEQSALIQSLNNNVAASLVGRTVSISGNQFPLAEEGEVTLGFELAGPAESVTVNIYDGSGEIVDTIGLDDLEAGLHRIEWDGLDSDGDRAAVGTYYSEVLATDADGGSVTAVPFFSGTVDSIAFENGVAYLNVDGMPVALAALWEVLNEDSAAAAE